MSKRSGTTGIESWLAAAAHDEGFAFISIGPASLPDYAAKGLTAFLGNQSEGDMDWLRDSAPRRSAPRNMWGEAKSAIICAMNYGPDHNPMDNLAKRNAGNISVYARGRDYHDVMKGRLKQLASQFEARSGAAVKVFVDTAPLMEKPLAVMAGAGWQGKHTNLVSRTSGSWLFLGTILTDAELRYDLPEDALARLSENSPEAAPDKSDHCGSCRACLDVCPTNAFPAPYRLNASKCISYLTIEHKGHIPAQYRKAIGNRIFGCDDCLAVCPWNKYAEQASEAKLAAKAEATMPPLAELLALDDAGFRARFAGTPVRRAGYDRFMRNTLIAAGNSDDNGLVDLVLPHLIADNPLVRAMAVWAVRQLCGVAPAKDIRSKYHGNETDPDILAEWG